MDNNNKHYLEAIKDIYRSCDRERKKENKRELGKKSRKKITKVKDTKRE